MQKRLPMPSSEFLGWSAHCLLVVAATTLLSTACSHKEPPQALEVRPVRALKIAQRAEPSVIAMTGTVQAQTEINLAFRVDGRLTQRLVSVGDSVRKGQVVATLDPQNEESSLRGARAQLVAARAQHA